MITIDASAAVHNKAGLSRYGEELIRALVADPAHKGEYAVFYHDAATARPSALIRSLPGVSTAQSPRPWRLRALLAQLANLGQDDLLAGIPRPPDQRGPDIFHATEHLLPRFKRIKTVFTVHDLIFRFYPQHHLLLNRVFLTLSFPLFLRRADAIICVSEQSRRDTQRIYRVPEGKMRVIAEGVDPRFRRVTDPAALQRARKRYHLPERFILAVGTIEPRKNLATLFKAYAELIKEETGQRGEGRSQKSEDRGQRSEVRDQKAEVRGQKSEGRGQKAEAELRLVVAGRQGWMVESTLRVVHELGLTGLVRFTGFVADEDLPALYSLADAFAFPSVYEGFGLPPLEALACGAPVVCSDASSLPEVMGDAALLVPPLDVRGWMLALGRVLADADLRRDLSQRGPRQAARFTWQDAARRTRAVYDEMLKQ
ncbi:MAG: glycosyltransferase family 4 protein [Chloroflexi bacterium]|nr:glycosyltransferase family 4 protein [Chloroflexota bacterium]MCL5274831.1 glycosyltransferase family 4 protein [Chloroflexota bacterium]